MAKKITTKSIETILKNIEKAMGNTDVNEPAIVKAITLKDFKDVDVISFGYDDVDKAAGCGGVPQGKMIEIFGPESGGKSFLTLKLMASAQKMGMKCCLVDAENSYDPKWADQHGVDTDDMYIINKALSAEKILDYVDELCKSAAFGLIVIDSTAALIPFKELTGSTGDQDYALLARAMSKGCRKIVQHCAQTNTTVVFINQIRDKMGVMFGEKQTTPGGKALKFYSHQRIKVHPGTKVKVKEDGEDKVIARQSWVTFVKNKVASPFGTCIIEIVFDKAAKNPVVKLCKRAKDVKIISIRSNTYRISKDLFEGEKKNFDTGCKTTVELADYVIREDLVGKIMDAYIEIIENDEESEGVEDYILEMQADPESIVSPMEGEDITFEKSDEDIEKEIEAELG